MNAGLFPLPGLLRSPGAFQSPWRRVSSFTTARLYSIEHPFQNVPFAVQCLLRNRIAELGFRAGEITVHAQGAARAGGVAVILEPFAVKIVFNAAARFVVYDGGASALITAANWDVSFLVIA